MFSQWGPYVERCPFQKPSFTHRSKPRKKKGLLIRKKKVSPFSQIPRQRNSPPCSPSGAAMERNAPSPRANGLFIHSYLSESPKKEPFHEMGEKHTVTVHGDPNGWKAYIQCGVVWFPKEIVDSTSISTPLPCSLQHDTFRRSLGRPQLRQPACGVVILYRTSLHTCYHLPPDPGY